MLPRSDRNITFLSADRLRLQRFFGLGWDLTANASQDAGLRQALISKLASESGIRAVETLVDLMAEVETEGDPVPTFTDIITPFFRTISHPDVCSSILLENHITTICNFLYGSNGRRLITLFRCIATALTDLLLTESAQSEDHLRLGLTTSLAVLSRVTDLCQTAQLLEDLAPIIETFRACFPQGQILHPARQSLKKIERRLNLGSSMPEKSMHAVKDRAKQPSFQLEIDLPGQLSKHGPRHDNDHVNIHSIRILPTSEEIQSQRPEYLPPVDFSSTFLPGLPGLLDRQFRLLREDSIGGLRDAVSFAIDDATEKKSTLSKKESARTIAHKGAKVVRLEIDKRKALQIIVGFAQPPALRQKNAKQREEWWADSKQMQLDALVCLASEHGRTMFFSVCDPNPTAPFAPKEVENDNTKATPSLAELAYRRRRADMPSLHADSQRAELALTMVDFDSEDVKWLVSQMGKAAQSRNTLVEFPGVLLPSFKPTLEALQQMSRSLDLPFQDLIAPMNSDDEPRTQPPAYTHQRGFAFDLTPLLGATSERLTFRPGQAFDHDKLAESTTLDRAQQMSALHALGNNLALIQGPPGTGKSYTGVAILKTLLKNRISADLGPIICVCYTNHALDQLLESLVRDEVAQVIRIGARSKSEILQKINLFHVTQEIETTKTEKRQNWECHRGLDENLVEIDRILLLLQEPTSQNNIREYLENHYPQHFQELFSSGIDDEGFELVRARKQDQLRHWLNDPSNHQSSLSTPAVLQKSHDDPNQRWTDTTPASRSIRELSRAPLHQMSSAERHRLHEHWVSERMSELVDELLNALDGFYETKKGLEKCRQEVQLRCLLQAQVIGVTTSGLARNLEVLRRVRCKAIVCEEAGEVLEAHVLTALLPDVEHAILIGDHEQLRPTTSNHELRHDHPRGERFALDVSLFERLVRPTSGGFRLPFTTLKTQRRMHPSVSELIRKTLYPTLEDHPSVSHYPEVDGMRKRLYWLHHDQQEDSSSSPEMIKSFSKSNGYEVEIVAAIVSHLVRQGTYGLEDIVVLTPYLGQLRKIKQRLGNSFEIVVGDRDLADLDAQGIRDDNISMGGPTPLQKTTLLKTLRVATVDNFQGEEAKLIVISLVRSNDEGRCGFLKTSNRINVLLSRARHGMYIVGNSRTASSIPMWAEVIGLLQRNGNIGDKMALCCPRHVEKPIEVRTPDDFAIFSPEGGCNEKCASRLACGHACVNCCHSQVLHDAVRCLERCRRLKAGCAHPCPRPCGDACQPKCIHPVANVRLLCGHVHETLECYKAQNIETVSCHTKVDAVVPHCGHVVKIPCCNLPLKEDFECLARCDAELECGHKCTRKCKVCRVRQVGQIRESHICIKICGRSFATCNHTCQSICHGDTPCQLCNRPCQVRCSHSTCSKKCHEPCVPCVEDCAWQCPHQGNCRMPCAVPCDRLPCSLRCEKKLKCSHRCPSVCGEICPDVRYCQLCADDSVKDQMADYLLGSSYKDVDLDENPVIIPSCGHIQTVESMDGQMELQKFFEISDQDAQGERVLGLKADPTPFSTGDFKNCPMCRSPLRNINRYGRIVRRAWIDEATKKFIVWANAQFVPLTVKLDEIETRYRQIKAASEIDFGTSISSTSFRPEASATNAISLKGTRDAQFVTFSKLLGKQQRFKPIVQLRYNIAKFLKEVDVAEQPFSKIYDLVRDVRLHRGVEIDFAYIPDILQTRSRMLATVLQLRCDHTILLEMLALYQERPLGATLWTSRKLYVDFHLNRLDCEALIEEARDKSQPLNEVEGLLFWARFVTLERSVTEAQDRMSDLVLQAREHLMTAKAVCEGYPDQTRGMQEEVEEVGKMLRDSTFYLTVTNQEKAAVYAAMASEFRGTGHWYYCTNGHPFTIGECGMPMQTSVCPQCASPVGGQSHRAVEGVTQAVDLDAQFANMRIG